MQTDKTFWETIKNIDVRSIPIELLALYGFSVIVTVLSFIGLLWVFFNPSESFLKQIYEAVIPITGAFSPSYLFIAFMSPIYFASTPTDLIRKVLVYFMILEIAYGCLMFLLKYKFGFFMDEDNSPYTEVSNWRILWSFFLPIIWISFLMSPRVKGYFKQDRIIS